jgi:AcrR family transcriptional regulator
VTPTAEGMGTPDTDGATAADDAPTAVDGRGLRRQGRKTRNRLLDAGTEVLTERGYHSARVDDIVRAAETSHGTFYLYFADKEDLLRALVARCSEELTELATSLGEVDAGLAGEAALREWLGRFLEAYRRNQPVIRAWAEDQPGDPELAGLADESFGEVSAALRKRLTESGAGQDGRPKAPVSAVALLAMVERFAYFRTSRDLALDDEAALDSLARLIHRGFFAGAVST